MKIFGKIIAILYTIIFTFVFFAIILVFTISSYLKADFFTTLITSKEFMETKLSQLDIEFDGMEEIKEFCGEDCTVEDAIIVTASEGFGINEELVREALKDEDIQKELGEFISIIVQAETTGKQEYLYYEDYEYILKKDIAKKILKEMNYTNDDIKKIIEEYNKSVDKYNSAGGKGGAVVEQATSSVR